MGEEVEDVPSSSSSSSGDHHANQTSRTRTSPKLTLLPLIALIFYEVSGGPFGIKDSVRAGGGPLLSLLGFLIFPIFWSIPEALITAELATSFPCNGGYVLWISAAFGPFWGFQEGFWKWFSVVMDNALYPVLFPDYLKRTLPVFDLLTVRIPVLLGITASLTYLNYRGLQIVGLSAVSLAAFSFLPFVAMVVLAVPRIQPRNWLGVISIVCSGTSITGIRSTLAGEVENPSRTFPRALLGAVILMMCSYLIPLLAGTGALDSLPSQWSDGYLAEVGFFIGGVLLRGWIQAAAAMSNMGLFEAEMSSDAFQLLGMSEMGMLPSIFASRSKHGTPTISILCSATGVIFLSWMTFREILEFLSFLYSVRMLLEFVAFLRLRIKKPDLHRPYRVPLRTLGATMLCLPPTLLLVLVMCLASKKTVIVSGTVMVVGFLLYPAIINAKDRQWLRFNDASDDNDTKSEVPQDEVEVGLLSKATLAETARIAAEELNLTSCSALCKTKLCS